MQNEPNSAKNYYAEEKEREAWPLTWGYWLWGVPIKILIVMDGRIYPDYNTSEFALGYVLDTLANTAPWWTTPEVDIAKRDGDLTAGGIGGLGPHHNRYSNFRFDAAGFNLNQYDQVWFFGDLPNKMDGADGYTDDPDIPGPTALTASELKLLAEWMDAGGGVFATGDHNLLGATLCYQIPRVRTMRRWTHEQHVPTRDGDTRHETLQPPSSPEPLVREQDTVLQRVELLAERTIYGANTPFEDKRFPHALFCSTLGPIDQFPDHMHEGEVLEQVPYHRPLHIPGYEGVEYPVTPDNFRPLPEVVAFGRTTNNFPAKRFGLVGVYDGNPVSIGRVVVDSTWHHWLCMNLKGIRDAQLPAYAKMQAYYRNVAFWLGRRSQRRTMLVAATWGVLTGSTTIEFVRSEDPWTLGAKLLSFFTYTISPCVLQELVISVLDPNANIMSSNELPPWNGLPFETINLAVVGGLGSGLIDLALDHKEQRGEHPPLDFPAIGRAAQDGVKRAHKLLEDAVDAASAALKITRDSVATVARTPFEISIPRSARRLRIVTDRLQFPDPTDPVLFDRTVTITLRVLLGNDFVSHQTQHEIKLPVFSAAGAIIDLNQTYDVEIHQNETLTIELFAGNSNPEDPSPNSLRFQDILSGSTSKWIGERVPDRTQQWRLWYRIEALKDR